MELWSADQAAQHWGVTPARARGILSARHITRISGYPADDIRAVQRRQGARTDLTPPATAWPLAAIAGAMADYPTDDKRRLRIFFEFMRGADEAGTAALPLTTDEPPLTGDARFDALLAACAEYISTRCARPGPLWTLTIDRFLTTPWWVSSLPSARTEAMVWTPAPFRRRGIYLDRHDLNHDGVEAPASEPHFDAEGIHAGFTALAETLHRENIVGHIHVFGSVAMPLAYDPTRTASRDICALFTSVGPMITAIREVAAENHWPTTWLNNRAVVYVSRKPGEGQRVFDHSNFQVMATPPEHLMATKVLAARATRDAHDLRTLFTHLHISQPTEVWPNLNRFFPETEIPARAQALIEVLLAEQPDQ